MVDQERGRHREADSARDHQELALEPAQEGASPRRAERRHDRDHGRGVDHEVAGRPGQCGQDTGEADVGLRRAVQRGEHDGSDTHRRQHLAGVEHRLDERATLDRLGRDAHECEDQHGHRRGHEQDEEDEERLVHIDPVRFTVDVQRDRPDPGGGHRARQTRPRRVTARPPGQPTRAMADSDRASVTRPDAAQSATTTRAVLGRVTASPALPPPSTSL